MNNNLKNYIILALVVVVALLALYLLPKKDDKPAVTVTNFLECLEAGYPVSESYPRQCRDANGKNYIEDITENAEVVVESPAWGATVTSPFVVTGKAKGTWFFEANLPVTLQDSNGKVLAQKGAQAQGEWMTEDYVNFSANLQFATPETEMGVLLIQKDNPSGMPENDASYAIPVRFR